MKLSPFVAHARPELSRTARDAPQGGAINPDAMEVPDLEATKAERALLDGETPEEVHEAAKQFETYFLGHLMSAMRRTVPDDGLFEGGFSGDVYTEMLDQEYAKMATDYGGIGLAAMLEQQLLNGGGE
jgi:Rod binding domain-containing protein